MLGLSASLIISRIITLIIAFTVHEFAHAWTADRFGDNTPRMHGRLTLNPAVHLDLVGTLMLLFAGFGWAKPVPVNPYALRKHSRSAYMWVSLAGPLSNFILAIFAALLLRFQLIPTFSSYPSFLPTPVYFIQVFFSVNLLLMVFNLIPLAPLDGEKVLEYFLPPSGVQFLEQIRPYSPMILIMLVFVLPQFGFDFLGLILNPIYRLISIILF